jgi:hypothetical protein|nr:MAG TPA: hypothetical protein [Caudoviricetes sp.]DAX33736.1 MAG TPA: hypothetical protein [Caudoviricetes sp.]
MAKLNSKAGLKGGKPYGLLVLWQNIQKKS